MSDYDEFEAWSIPKRRKNRKKDAKRVNVYPRLAGGIDEIPQMLGKEPLAAEDRPEEERMTRERAEALAGEILGWLEPLTDYAEVAGSYRRGRQDPGDLDVIVILKNRVKLPEIAELWLAEGKASAVNWVGEKKTQLLIDGVKVDIRTSTPRALGAALLYFTGPAGYNIGIRSAAKRAGFKLSEYGLFDRETGEYIAGATEEEIYTAMGRNYRPPTERRAEENVKIFEAPTCLYCDEDEDGRYVEIDECSCDFCFNCGEHTYNGYELKEKYAEPDVRLCDACYAIPNFPITGKMWAYENSRGQPTANIFDFDEGNWAMWENPSWQRLAKGQMGRKGQLMNDMNKWTLPGQYGWTRDKFEVEFRIYPWFYGYDANREPRWAYDRSEIDVKINDYYERRAEENVSFATEENNEMQEAIIRGLRNLARDGYVVAAPPFGNRSRTFYQQLSTEIMSELAELGSDDEGPEVTGSGRAIDPYNVVRSLARNESFSMPDEDLSIGIGDMVTSFTQQSTMMDEQDGFIPPEGYTKMEFDLPYNGLITRRLGWRIAFAMGIYSRALDSITLYSTPQKNRNCSMIINMVVEDLQPEVSGMTDMEKEQFYQEFGMEIMRQLNYWGGPLQEELARNREWVADNYGAHRTVTNVIVRDDIKGRAVTAAQRLNPFSAESYTPPASAISAAKRGLEQRKKYGRGGLSPAEAKSQGIDSGVTRARKIASGKVSKHDVRRMSAFNRHRKNNNPGKKMPDGGPTAGTIAWNLWGGSAGVNWAKKKSAAMNAEDYAAKSAEWDMNINWNSRCPKCGKSADNPFRTKEYDGYVRTTYYCDCDVGLNTAGGFPYSCCGEEMSWFDTDGSRYYWHCYVCQKDYDADEFGNIKKSATMNAENFEAEAWDDSVSLTQTCSCGRRVKPYDVEMKQWSDGSKYVSAKYRCNCGGGKCRNCRYGPAEYMGLCSRCATCERCNMSLKQDYEEMGRDEGHEHYFCHMCYDETGRYGAETQEFADRFEIQIRTSRGNTTERIPVGRSMLVRRLREILGRSRQPYAIDVFGTEAAFNVMGPYGMQVYRPKPKLLAVYKYGQFESGEMADHLNEKLGLI